MSVTKQQRYQARWTSLKNERSSWDSPARELAEFILPRAGRFFPSDRNEGGKRNTSILDSTATRALRTLGAGMMSGNTSPARPWFKLATPDEDLMEFAPVKQWLADGTVLMQRVFRKSNTYRTLHALYEELGLFGTGASIVVPDFDTVIHHHGQTFGEYAIATNGKGEVDTIYREFDMPLGALVGEFGVENCSLTVRNLYDGATRGTNAAGLDQWVRVIHAIQPRRDRDYSARDAKNMPWASCYFEAGRENDAMLRESGFRRFRGLVPRWFLTGGDIYGSSPGQDAIGDVKQLQQQQLRKAQGIDYKTRPPLQGPTHLKEGGVNLLPGGFTFIDVAGAQQKIEPLFDARHLDLQHLLADIQDVRQRVNQSFYADLFLMLVNSDNKDMTATEVAERHEEKLLMLGPVLERLNNELLDPLIDITFDDMLAAGMLPPPPPEMQGMDLEVEYVSVLAQAQRAVGLTAVNRLLGTVQAVAAVGKVDVVDKIDGDQIVDRVADMLGVDPSMVVADDKVAIVRDERAKAQQAAQRMQGAMAAAATAKDLAAADTGSQNALTDVMRGLQGYTGA